MPHPIEFDRWPAAARLLVPDVARRERRPARPSWATRPRGCAAAGFVVCSTLTEQLVDEEVSVFVVTNRIPVAAGHEADFEERFRNRAHLIDRSPGFIKNLVMRPVQRRFNHQTGQWETLAEQGYYLVQTYWESEQAFWDWTRSESFRKAHSNRPPAEMFAGANVLEIHEVVFTTELRPA